ncbi:tripartite tricarboxylate transporter substrate binding protein [Ramlibacter sp. AW1]|uniref:Tripartite tricarboxylate transporter substrate binding protein n=1 Tax=Ramlibacter aurantiacus TaxID=2801330 RepID=A0A936ZHE3_9BURK|nr:tripartite tricarboxylate transporter substrate-binding protein [Ramlibacter aurantiacus]MBL0420957.1 tripartite tricarboxylate transporter substrate binding protein [Ramlibacter aurantiacus]
MNVLTHNLRRGALLLAAISMSGAALAQDAYPSRPITLLVGFPSGGPADIAARIVAQGLTESLKQSVVVENRTGAGGNIATQAVAKAPADGYTILVATASFTLNAVQDPAKAGYDAVKDFVPVALVATQANAITVNANFPAKSIAELQSVMKSKSVNFATSGVGTSSHLSAAHLFRAIWKTDAVAIPYRGAGPAAVAVAAGDPPVSFTTATAVLPLVQQGKVRVLGVVSDTRIPSLPDVPTLAQSGYPQLTPSSTAVYVSSATPPAIRQKLNETINKFMAQPTYKEKFVAAGMEPVDGRSLAELQKYNTDEVRIWGEIVKAVGSDAK